MNVSPINNQEVKPTFNASIKPNKAWMDYINYLEYHSVPRDIYSDYTKKNFDLINKVKEAIEKHPSSAELEFSACGVNKETRGGLICGWFLSGAVKSPFGKLYDIEPARDDSGTAPIENLLRKLLNPENKDLFNRLMGVKNKGYSTWWDENIQPIWNDIVENFREETSVESENHVKWDKKMNIGFRIYNNIEMLNSKKSEKGLTVADYIKYKYNKFKLMLYNITFN